MHPGRLLRALIRNGPTGWPILASGFVVMAVSGLLWNSFGLFLVALEQEFGWTRAQISLGSTIFMIANAATAPLVGHLIGRFDTRIVLAGLALCLTSGLAATACIDSPLTFYLAFGLLAGMGAQSCSSFALFTILGNWFRGRATPLSIVDAGFGIGVFLGLPLLMGIVETYGWRAGYLVMAAAVACAVLPVNALLMRLHPAAPQTPPEVARATPSTTATAGSVLTRPSIVWIACTFLLGPFAYHALLTQQIALVSDVGIGPTGAVWIASIVGLFIFVCRLSAGWLIDARGELFAMRWAAVTAALATLLLLFVVTWRVDALLFLYPPLMGAGFGAQAILLACGLRLLVSGPGFPVVYGMLRLAGGAGMAAGPITAAAIFDLTDSYALALVLILLTIVMQYATFRKALQASQPGAVGEPCHAPSQEGGRAARRNFR